ncbi:tRNA-dihydrouridine synthase [Arenimonas sp.]|nr:tRNA-dihydrouridine synthase [Candidatus Parcubacteria bacterium]
MSFIQKLKQGKKRPLFVLAPMADVTDVAFRTVIAEAASPDIFWTEFVSADGLIRATDVGKYKLKKDLLFDKELQRPIIVQLFSSTYQYMYEATKLCVELGFNGVDINMGCPDKSIEKQKCGAAMIKNPELAVEVIKACKDARRDFADENFSVSVKTRLGYNAVELDSWIPLLLEQELDLITIHARTRKEMSKVEANWDHVKTVVKMRDDWAENNPTKTIPLIFGNGDVVSVEDGFSKCKNFNADGSMIGRAMFGNPWFFKDIESKEKFIPTREDRIKTLIRQVEVFDKELGDVKSFAVMKKFFKTYMNGFEDAKEIREEIMRMESAGEVVEFFKRKVDTR